VFFLNQNRVEEFYLQKHIKINLKKFCRNKNSCIFASAKEDKLIIMVRSSRG
jgi:hypothetical protein